MTVRRSQRHLIALAIVACVTLTAVPGALGCGASGYSYAGIASSANAFGIAATVTPLPAFDVASGHVAGWVGVGGPKQGPAGSDEWLQVGASVFPGVPGGELYYELKLPGAPAAYHLVASGWQLGHPKRVAVLELRTHPNHWRVWVDGAPVSQPLFLPGSHGRWQPIATAESWDGPDASCNAFLFRFHDVAVARRPGGSWSPLVDWSPVSSVGPRISHSRAAFLVGKGGRALKLMASLIP
jgi:hypothetical protein